MTRAAESLDGWKDSDLLSLPVERYLHEFRGGLLSLPESERDLIVSEVRAQVAAQARLGDGAVQALLEKLGKPDRLAARFTIRHELSVGVQQSNPFALLWVLLRLAAGSLLAFTGGLVVIVFGLTGLLLTAMPVLRFFVPQDVFVRNDGLFTITVTTGDAPKNAIPLSWEAAVVSCGVGIVLIVLAMLLMRGLGQILLRDMRRKTRMRD
ncbi:hypothetical protein HKD28_05410 [Gluconobacter sp. LMG 1744]|uniref:HAAS signaling domain-containing protein n=1 Tax=Gluconobacter cadivus TaxID=2728101 RepID=UPI0018858E91|nr:hypothetical protein [Gluconobacter cadivus]MBF0890862.1 hypothetical protein [Gluconobacter cadivus]